MAISRPANVRSHRRGGARRRRSPWLAAALVAVLVLGGMTAGYVYVVHRSCSGRYAGTIAASQDITPILQSLNEQWAATDPAAGGRCVSVTIEARDSALMATLLGSAWNSTFSGPAPDVWVPESSVWIRQAAADPDAERMIPDLQPSLARTPAVVAMPKSMATALGWPKTAIDWPDLAKYAGDQAFWADRGHKDWGHFQLDMTNPTNSTAGLLTLMAIADGNNDGEVDAGEQAGLYSLKQAMNKYTSDTSDITAALATADASSSSSALHTVSAFPALEHDVIAYNRANPKEPLIAFYPKSGSYDANHPYLILNAPWSAHNPGGAIAAKAFLSFARGAKGRQAFLDAGFRDSNRHGDEAMNETNGVEPVIEPLPRAVLAPDSVDETLTTWTAVTRPTNLLLVLDVSGSMNSVVLGDKTRMQLAKEAASKAIEQFDSEANVGLWVFSSDISGSRNYKVITPLGGLGDTMPDGNTRKADMLEAIAALKARGNTGLYDAIAAAQADVIAHYQPDATNLVVLMTDGQDDSSSIDLAALEVKLTKAREGDKNVPVVTIAYGSDADLAHLQEISQASGTTALSATSTFDINKVLLAALFGKV